MMMFTMAVTRLAVVAAIGTEEISSANLTSSDHRCIEDGHCAGSWSRCCTYKAHRTLRCESGWRCGDADLGDESEVAEPDHSHSKLDGSEPKGVEVGLGEAVIQSGEKSGCLPDGTCAEAEPKGKDSILNCCNGYHKNIWSGCSQEKTYKCGPKKHDSDAEESDHSASQFNTSELEESETFLEFEAAISEDKQLASWSAGSGHRCIPVGTCLGNYPVADDCCGRQMHYTMRCCDVGACYRCGAAEEEEGTPSLQVHDLGDEAEDEESNYSDAQLNATIDSSGHRCIADGLCSFGDIEHCCNGWHYTLNCPDQYRCGVIKMEEEGTFVV
jgi:hypothetical protein